MDRGEVLDEARLVEHSHAWESRVGSIQHRADVEQRAEVSLYREPPAVKDFWPTREQAAHLQLPSVPDSTCGT